MFYKLSILHNGDLSPKEIVQLRNSLYPDELFKTQPRKSNHGLFYKLMYSLGQKKILNISPEKRKDLGLINIVDLLPANEYFNTDPTEVTTFYMIDETYNSNNVRYLMSTDRFVNQAATYFQKMIPNVVIQVQKVDEIPQLNRISWIKKEIAARLTADNKEFFFNLSQDLDESERIELFIFLESVFEGKLPLIEISYSEKLFTLNERLPFLLHIKLENTVG